MELKKDFWSADGEVRLATEADKDDLIHIISKSFVEDPCFKWLLEKSNHAAKATELSRYLVEETFVKGFACITRDKTAAALWHTSTKEKVTLSYILRDLRYVFKLGLATVDRSLDLLKLKRGLSPAEDSLYLACIGVLPVAQGRGLSKKLIEPVIKRCQNSGQLVYLETANLTNVSIYERRGFRMTDEVKMDWMTLYFMEVS
ncbi:MAG: GNAT family N-acetyltransferase [Sphingobacterium sp.]|jgi:GNAT superfamily N-acetyltransferase|nr:GNAT family N-acetyltransferase [Sphingobacterium sp.]